MFESASFPLLLEAGCYSRRVRISGRGWRERDDFGQDWEVDRLQVAVVLKSGVSCLRCTCFFFSRFLAGASSRSGKIKGAGMIGTEEARRHGNGVRWA